MRRRRRGFGPALALLACLAACGGKEPAPAGVVHLDLWLAGGASPAAELDARGHVVRRFPVSGPERVAEEVAPWTFENCVFAAPEDGGGVVVRAADYRPEDGVVYAALSFGEPLDAAEVNRIEVDLESFHAGNATLTWETAEPVPGLPPGALRLDAVTVADRPQTVVLALAGHPGWRGRITGLKLFPSWKGGQSYLLRGLRLAWDPFEPGPQPGSAHGERSGDAGLMGFAADLRRTWPSDPGVPLYASLRVPDGARLAVDVALASELAESLEPAHFAIDARVGGGEWQTRARRSTVPQRYLEAARWRPLSAELGDLAGRDVELRFRAWLGGARFGEDGGTDAGTEGTLERGRVRWGAPMVLPARDGARRRSLLVVTLDTLRTDAVGCYGGPPITPAIDALAAEGILFEDAWTVCNSTLPSHTSILTGLSVPAHGVLDNRSTLAPEVRTLAQALRAAGYHTAAAVSVEHLQPGYSGLGRGFDQYLEVVPGATVDGARTLRTVSAWLETWRDQGPRPFFLWVHLFDPHAPYGPPPVFLEEHARRCAARGAGVPPREADPATVGTTRYTRPGEFLEGVSNHDYARYLYEASVAYTDELVRDLLWMVRDAGFWEDTAVVLTADHGESLGEHGVWYGHQLVHPPVMHVPLVLRVPEGPAGLRVDARASNGDVARTALAWLGVTGLDAGGADLLELAAGGGDRDRRVWFVHANSDQVGCRDGDVHYFHNVNEYLQLGPERRQAKGLDFLYRHAIDPGASTNLADVEPELAAKYQNAMRAWLAAAASGRHVAADVGAEADERLEALGYGGGEE